MKRSTLFRLVFFGIAVLAIQIGRAGSAVAITKDGHGHMASSAGYPEKIARQRAIDRCRRRYGADARILASTDVTGYGSIAVARKGTGSVIGVALGKRSASEADALAIDYCLKAGGTDPKIIQGFRG